MTDIDSLVREFHEAMNLPVATELGVPADERVRLRARLITEEYFETMRALFSGRCPDIDEAENCLAHAIEQEPVSVDLVELADGLCDLDYVVAGTRLELGIPGKAVLAEVHKSNLAKVGGPISPQGKQLKPPGWTPPDIAGVLERHKGAKP